MSYKTLLALHPLDESLSRLDPIAALAGAFEAHVHALVLDPMAPIPTLTFVQEPVSAWNGTFAEQLRTMEHRAIAVREYLEGKGIEASVAGEVQQMGLIDKAVATSALASDLVVLGTERSLLAGLMGHALEGALFGAGRPVLVLGAHGAPAPTAPAEAMIAWDGGPEAGRAVQQALPLLRAAGNVRLMIVEEQSESELATSAHALRRHLLRHGVDAHIEGVAPAGRFVAHAFVEHVASRRPELLVMGAYGHARLRERLFAGVTRAALGELENALFLSH